MSQINVNQIVDASGGVLAPISSVMRNRIINGDMRIDQRNAGASVNTASAFPVDRFFLRQSTNGKFTAQQNGGSVTPPAGFVNYLGMTSSSAYSIVSSDIYGFIQRIEGYNIADLNWGSANAKTVTLSFWVRSSLTGTFGGSIQNGAGDRSYPFTFIINAANTWEYETITITGDTSGTWLTTNGHGLQLSFGLGVGATFSGTAGAWAGSQFFSATGATSVVGTNGATFYITGVQLEKGTQATSFEYRQYGTELALCRRYYAGGDGYMTLHPLTADGSGGFLRSQVYFDTPMRAAPTIALISSVNIGGTQAITANKVGFYADGISNTAYVYSNDGFTRSAEL